jgi:hypothetical protein
VVGVMPVREADLTNRSYLWDHPYDASFTPADLAPGGRHPAAEGAGTERGPANDAGPRVGSHRGKRLPCSPLYWGSSGRRMIVSELFLSEPTTKIV